MPDLPTGVVTFLSTDIEGSTRLLRQLGDGYRAVFETHQRLLRAAFRAGRELRTQGDAFLVAFQHPRAAVEAAIEAQRALAAEPWPDGVDVRVRMGLHTGTPQLGGDDYVGIDLHRAARIGAGAHGGQVVLSEDTRRAVTESLPPGVTVRPLGHHRFKDIAEPETLFQLVVPGLRDTFPPLRSLLRPRSNLPVEVTSFVGRQRELADLEGLLGSVRCVTVTGAGGTGKTRLVVHLAATLADRYADGAWLVELAQITTGDQVPGAVTRALDVPDVPGLAPEPLLTDFLREKQLLLVLDNCEHVLDAVADLVDARLAACPRLVVLASSREPLGVAGESVYRVPSLSTPAVSWAPDALEPDASLASLRTSEAVALFLDRARSADPAFALTTANAPAIAEITRRLDGIPLAVELAAARVAHLSPAEIASRLDDRFRLLTGGRRGALPRQQTLLAMIDWSWQLLDDLDRRLLAALSVFPASWTFAAAEAVAGDIAGHETLERVGRLVDRSLVQVDRGTPTRYRLLESIREYARARLAEAGELALRRDRHLAWHAALVLDAEPGLRGPEVGASLRRIDAEIDNILGAIEWAADSDPATAIRLYLALSLYWRSRGLAEGFDQLRRAVRILDRLGPSQAPDPSLVVRVLAAAGTASWQAGSPAEGLPLAERAVARSEGLDDALARSEALTALAVVSAFLGRIDDLEPWIREAVLLADEAGDSYGGALIQVDLAQWAAETRRPADARLALERAQELAARAGSPIAGAFVALAEGRVLGSAGDVDGARRALGAAADTYAGLGDEQLALVARSDLGHVLREAQLWAEAAGSLRGTIHEWLRSGNRGAIAHQLEAAADVAAAWGRNADAARLLGAAGSIREQAGTPPLPSEAEEIAELGSALLDRLGTDEHDAALRQGAGLSTAGAVTLALAALEAPVSA